MDYTRYEYPGGRVLEYGNMSEAVAGWLYENAPDENGYVFGVAYDGTYQIIDGVGHKRPEMQMTLDKVEILADDEDTATISGLPDPCTVLIDGAPHEVAGSTLQITSPVPGAYRVQVQEQWPYLDWEATVEAVDP